MANITVFEFRISERAESKFWQHGITRRQLNELLDNRLVAITNRKRRAARHIVIGRDNNGHRIVVPVMPTENPIIWRPVTAWYCEPSEATKLR
jgi:uncharacterized DUF497 family protein